LRAKSGRAARDLVFVHFVPLFLRLVGAAHPGRRPRTWCLQPAGLATTPSAPRQSSS